ncbi:MAG: PAS domain S-box protein [Alphaproteobacteria bacterium]|nr:PAS domain S-box protein [Alphaproteobacteria bacterium]
MPDVNPLTEPNTTAESLGTQLLRAIPYFTAWFVIAIACGMFFLLCVYNKDLVLDNVWLFDMQFNTALMFAASGIGLLATIKRINLFAIPASVFVILFSLLTFLQYIIPGLDVGTDQLFFVAPDYHPYTPSGRMAPNTCIAFICMGSALLVIALGDASNSRTAVIAETLAFLVFALGAESVAGYLHDITVAYSWGSTTRMSPHTALSDILLGTGLLSLVWLRQSTRISAMPLWIPGGLCFLILMCDVATPRGVASGIAYIPLIFCSLWFFQPRSTFFFAAIASALSIVGFLIKPSGESPEWTVLLNRVITIGALWFVAMLVYMRRHMETQLYDSESKLRAIVDHTIDGLITINERGTVESFNAACERIFGYSAGEVIGQNIKMLMPEPYHGEHDGYLRNYLTTGDAKIIGSAGREVAARRKNGTVFPIDLSISSFRLKGGQYFSGIIRDITDRKYAEAEKERLIHQLTASNTELERFAYICSHDLQEPLRMITSFSQKLSEHLADKMDEKARHYFDYIKDGAERSRQLVNDVLTYARIGGEQERNKTVNTQEIFDTVTLDLSQRIADCNGAVTHGHMPLVRANPTHVRQLLQNLIGNGLKFHGEIPPRVHVEAKQKGEMYSFSVADNGIGIAPAYHAKIFDIFQRLHSRHEYGGTGIGLAICKKIIQQYQGCTIQVQSQQGTGTTFTFTLPAADINESTAPQP